MPSFIRPTYKIVMEEFSSWRPCLGCFHSSRRCSPTAGIKDRNLRKRLQKFCRISTLKSSNVPIRSADLWSCQNAGSSSAPSLGSTAAEGSPRIGRTSTERRSRSCASPQSASCSENSAIRPEVSGRTLSLFPSELHIFVRPEIRSFSDLAGKKVNFNTQGTAGAYSGPLIFSRLGLDVEKMFIPHPVALEQMKRGEIAGVVFVTSKPVDAFVRGKWEEGFKFLPVEYGSKFEDYYLPSYLDPTDYPNLVAKGERIATIAVPTILAAFNWSLGSDRYRRVARFVAELYSGVDKLKTPGFDPKWKDVNLSTKVPGLERFQAAREWLDRASTAKQSGHP